MARNAQRRIGTLRPEKLAIAAVVADLLNITRDYFARLVKDGVLVQAKHKDGSFIVGRYDIKDCVHRYVAFLIDRTKQAKPSSAMAYEAARLSKMQALARRENIECAILEGQVYRADDVDAQITEMHVGVRSRLLGLPAHVSRLLLGKESFDEVCSILTHHMEQALRDLKVPSKESIQARNRKLARYAEAMRNGQSTDEEESYD